MGRPFERLEEAKQLKILDAAMAEFAEHGRDRASTNRIVAKAEISKGLLFHYFGSKERLYHYLVEYAVTYMSERLVTKMSIAETDFLQRYANAARLKLVCMAERPHLFDFMTRVSLHELDQLPPELRKRVEDVQDAGLAKLFAEVDTTLFRDDVDPDWVFKIISWVMNGYQRQVVNELSKEPQKESLSATETRPHRDGRSAKIRSDTAQPPSSIDTRPYWDDFYTLLAVLKRVLYRQEDENSDHCTSE